MYLYFSIEKKNNDDTIQQFKFNFIQISEMVNVSGV